jgi:tellurite resistance protein
MSDDPVSFYLRTYGGALAGGAAGAMATGAASRIAKAPLTGQGVLDSPFYQDTVLRTLGPEPVVSLARRPPPDRHFPGAAPEDVAGFVGGKDSLNLVPGQGDDYVAGHEAGHLFERRGLGGAATDSARAAYPDFARRHPDEYGAAHPEEYTAETFAQAMMHVRAGSTREEVEAQDRDMPGVAPMFDVIQQRLQRYGLPERAGAAIADATAGAVGSIGRPAHARSDEDPVEHYLRTYGGAEPETPGIARTFVSGLADAADILANAGTGSSRSFARAESKFGRTGAQALRIEENKPEPEQVISAGRSLVSALFPIGEVVETGVGGAVNLARGEERPFAKAYQEGAFRAGVGAVGLEDDLDRLYERNMAAGLAVDLLGGGATGGGAEALARAGARRYAAPILETARRGPGLGRAAVERTLAQMAPEPTGLGAFPDAGGAAPAATRGYPNAPGRVSPGTHTLPRGEPDLLEPVAPPALLGVASEEAAPPFTGPRPVEPETPPPVASGLLRSDAELERLADEAERTLFAAENRGVDLIRSDRSGSVVGAETDFDRIVRQAVSGDERARGALSQMYEAAEPVRSRLREQHGPTITLYRSEFRDPSGRVEGKPTTYYADRRFASRFGDPDERELVSREVPVDEIIHAGPASVDGGVEFLVANDPSALRLALHRAAAAPATPGRLVANEAGAASPYAVRAVAQAGVGAGVGAAVDQEDPLRGAVVGAGLGALSAPGSWDRLVALKNTAADRTWSRNPALGNFLFTGHNLPDEYRAAKETLRRGMSEARMVAQDIHRRAREYPQAVQELMSKLADEGADAATATRALEGAGVENAPEAAALIADMHQMFAGFADDLFGLNQLSKESIEKYGGRYLPRYYRAADDAAGETPARATAKTVRLDRDALGRLAQRSDDVSPEMAERRVEHFGFRATAGALQEGRLVAGERFFQAVRGMDDVVHAETRELGDEIAATAKLRAALPKGANAEFRAASEEISALKAELKAQEQAAANAGFVKLPDSPQLGSLRGTWVAPEVAEDLKGLTEMAGPILRQYDKWLRRWKLGKTVLNPATHGRNIIGAQILSYMGGGPLPFTGPYRRAFAIARRADDPRTLSAAQRAIYDEARAQGIFDSSWVKDDQLPQFRQGFAINAPGGTDELAREVAEVTGEGRGLARRGFDAAAKAYHDEDVAARLAHYIHQRAKGLEPAEAAALAKKWVPTFTNQSDAVRMWSRVVPFFGYTAAALPLVAESAARRPVRFLAAGALTTALGSMFFDDDVPDDVLPPEMRGGPLRTVLPRFVPTPFGGEGGKRSYLDFTYIMPWGDLGEGKTGGYGPLDALPGQLNPMSNPLAGTLGALTLNKERLTGKEITRRSMSAGEKVGASLDYVYKQALPSLTPGIPDVVPVLGDVDGGWGWEKSRDAITRRPNRWTGDVPSIPGTLAGTVAGLKTRTIDPQVEYQRRHRELNREMQDLRERLRDVVRDKGVSPGAKREARENFAEARGRIAAARARLRQVWQARQTDEPPAAALAADPVEEYLRTYGRPPE